MNALAQPVSDIFEDILRPHLDKIAQNSFRVLFFDGDGQTKFGTVILRSRTSDVRLSIIFVTDYVTHIIKGTRIVTIDVDDENRTVCLPYVESFNYREYLPANTMTTG
jgi:hypothetical protein